MINWIDSKIGRKIDQLSDLLQQNFLHTHTRLHSCVNVSPFYCYEKKMLIMLILWGIYQICYYKFLLATRSASRFFSGNFFRAVRFSVSLSI